MHDLRPDLIEGVGLEQQGETGCRVAIAVHAGERLHVGDPAIAHQVGEHPRHVDGAIAGKQRTTETLGPARVERAGQRQAQFTATRRARAPMCAEHRRRLADAGAQAANRIAGEKLSADLALRGAPLLQGGQRRLRVTGQGNANLVNKAIDFQMLASVLKAPGASVADIPLKITGTYVDPTVRPDAEALAKGQIKQKLQDVLKKNGLQGLFGK